MLPARQGGQAADTYLRQRQSSRAIGSGENATFVASAAAWARGRISALGADGRCANWSSAGRIGEKALSAPSCFFLPPNRSSSTLHRRAQRPVRTIAARVVGSSSRVKAAVVRVLSAPGSSPAVARRPVDRRRWMMTTAMAQLLNSSRFCHHCRGRRQRLLSSRLK